MTGALMGFSGLVTLSGLIGLIGFVGLSIDLTQLLVIWIQEPNAGVEYGSEHVDVLCSSMNPVYPASHASVLCSVASKQVGGSCVQLSDVVVQGLQWAHIMKPVPTWSLSSYGVNFNLHKEWQNTGGQGRSVLDVRAERLQAFQATFNEMNTQSAQGQAEALRRKIAQLTDDFNTLRKLGRTDMTPEQFQQYKQAAVDAFTGAGEERSRSSTENSCPPAYFLTETERNSFVIPVSSIVASSASCKWSNKRTVKTFAKNDRYAISKFKHRWCLSQPYLPRNLNVWGNPCPDFHCFQLGLCFKLLLSKHHFSFELVPL